MISGAPKLDAEIVPSLLDSVRLSGRLLPHRDRRQLMIATLVQGSTSLLDLVGVLLIAVVAGVAVTTVQSQPFPQQIVPLLDFLGLGDSSGQTVVLVLSAAAAAFFLLKSVLASYLNRRLFRFLANRQAYVAVSLARRLFSQPISVLQQATSQETTYALMQGASAATLGVLGQAIILASELALLVVVLVALVAFDPLVTMAAAGFFLIVAFTLHQVSGRWAASLGRRVAGPDIATLSIIQELTGAYRELLVSNRVQSLVTRLGEQRSEAASVTADLQFVALLPKYIFEAAAIVGAVLLGMAVFSMQDSVGAVATLALFMAAAYRVLPSLLRIQGALLVIKSAAGVALPTYVLGETLPPVSQDVDGVLEPAARCVVGSPRPFTPRVVVAGLNLRHPDSSTYALRDIDITVEPGEFVGVVGPSGAGKSSLLDCILGVRVPSSGEVLISGDPPRDSFAVWPDSVGYVPQAVFMATATVRENVAIGINPSKINDAKVEEVLRATQLWDLFERDREGIWTLIGEGGARLSGGQRQRLGIARALYSEPSLLILDEATSAMDAETEHLITRTLDELAHQMTRIVVAHRLSTIRNAHRVIYMDSGRVLAQGSFDDLRDCVPGFESAVNLQQF